MHDISDEFTSHVTDGPAVSRPLREQYEEPYGPVVSVFNWTFNHRDFIRESIESILDQRTSFPVEIIIHDDASTDGTAEIVREYSEKYPSLFRNVMQRENQYSKGGNLLLPLAIYPRGRYVALVDGDDFWTDPQKLQKQVDLLESDPQVVLTGHRFRLASAESSDTGCLSMVERSRGGLEDILLRNYVHTSSAMFRNGILKPEMLVDPPDAGDWFIWVQLAKHGEIGFINEVMSGYRIHAGGVASGLSLKKKVASVSRTVPRLHRDFGPRYRQIMNQSLADYRLQVAAQCLGQREPSVVVYGIWLWLRALQLAPTFTMRHRLKATLQTQLVMVVQRYFNISEYFRRSLRGFRRVVSKVIRGLLPTYFR